LTIPPPGETLHEFILSVLSGTFGEDWRAEQTALPVGEQHFVLRCFSELVSSRAATPIPATRPRGCDVQPNRTAG
jgi:hypothetical protein